MPNTNHDQLYEEFVSVAGDFVAISGGITGLLGGLAAPSPAPGPAGVTAAATGASAVSDTLSSVVKLVGGGGSAFAPFGSAAAAGGGGGPLDTLGSVAKSIGENALGALPLIRGIISLFTGGDDSPAPPKLTKYLLPPSIQFEGADTPAGIRDVDRDQTSAPRAFGAAPYGSPAAGEPAQVTVNIQAMDARSFLDRSSEIAAAVREAMLNSSSLNDVVSEL